MKEARQASAGSGLPAALNDAVGAPCLPTLLLCDLVGSTALTARLGDRRAAALMRRHDRLARDALQRHGGHELERTDGFLLLFERPRAALAFAFEYQRLLHGLGGELGLRLQARIALHADEVEEGAGDVAAVVRGARASELLRQPRAVLAHLIEQARPGQLLMTDVTALLLQDVDADAVPGVDVRWRSHGWFRLPAMTMPVQVFEAAMPGVRLRRPLLRGQPWRLRVQHLRREVLGLVVAIGLLLGVGAAWLLRSDDGLAFAERDWVVLGHLQNDTAHAHLSEPLEAVLRIGLQQSRHVNVMPVPRVQAALQRMRREDDSPIDRMLGQQLALREGARALVLPSLAPLDGGFRVGIEVIEPHSGVSVFSAAEVAADEAGLLHACDRLLARLRRQLGESLATIAESGGPLEQITTASLDALAAMAAAETAFAAGSIEAGIAELDRALELDPEFGMALARRGIVELQWLERPDRAARSWQQALALSVHLSDREKRWVEGMQALAFGPLADAVATWSAFAQLYPDVGTGHHNLGVALRHRQHRLVDAVSAFRAATQSRHPMRGHSWLALAETLTELNELDAAGAAIDAARALGHDGFAFTDVLVDLAARRHDRVDARLQAVGTLPPLRAAERAARHAASLADRGRLAEAAAVLDALDIEPLPLRVQARLRLQRAALALARAEPGDAIAPLIALHDRRLDAHDPGLDRSLLLHAAFATSLAVRARHPQSAALLARAEAIGERPGHYVEPAFLRLARCEAAHRGRTGNGLLACVRPLLDGREFVQMRIVHAQALLAAGDPRAALEAASAVVAQRGAAVAELEGMPLQLPNLLDLAALELLAAEAALELGDELTAHARLSAFAAQWAQADPDLPLLQHAQALRVRLQAAAARR